MSTATLCTLFSPNTLFTMCSKSGRPVSGTICDWRRDSDSSCCAGGFGEDGEVTWTIKVGAWKEYELGRRLGGKAETSRGGAQAVSASERTVQIWWICWGDAENAVCPADRVRCESWLLISSL